MVNLPNLHPYVRFANKYRMSRPMCTACNKIFAAINCYRGTKVYYRSRCDLCIRLNRKQKPAVPKWKHAGYLKKPICDRCGFKFKLSLQSAVYHIDGDLNNVDFTNLRTICLNCIPEIVKLDLGWQPGSPEAD
jgi:hypothetical protein